MGKQKYITRLVPRIGKPPRLYNLVPWEFEITKSMDSCSLEHSHFIAEQCRLSGATTALLLRYTKESDGKRIEDCAKEIGLKFVGYWKESYKEDDWLHIPALARQIRDEINHEMLEWQLKQNK